MLDDMKQYDRVKMSRRQTGIRQHTLNNFEAEMLASIFGDGLPRFQPHGLPTISANSFEKDPGEAADLEQTPTVWARLVQGNECSQIVGELGLLFLEILAEGRQSGVVHFGPF